MSKKISHSIIAISMMAFTHLCAQNDPTIVRFVNVGQMNVNVNPSTSLYIPDGIKMMGEDVLVAHDGVTVIGGNFYHDEAGNVFTVDSDGRTTSKGIIRFGENTGVERYITATEFDEYERSINYIAFPYIEIDTEDEIHLPAKMGMDAINVTRVSGKKGTLHLRSDLLNDTVIYDASLRITGKDRVSEGAVIVQRYIKEYHPIEALFPFASPYFSMEAGYFAGNWVRHPEKDNDAHVTYIYGNKPDTDNSSIIAIDQYLTKFEETFTPGDGYLIKLRKDYTELPYGLLVTDGRMPESFLEDKYVFHGNPHDNYEEAADETLFSGENLFSKNYTGEGKTINWIIGNSYTSAIDYDKVIEKMEESSLVFEPYIYIFFLGHSTFTPLPLYADAPQLDLPQEIPAMSIFMVRLSRNVKQNGTFSIGPEIQVHGKVCYTNPLKSQKMNKYNDILFTVTPQDKEIIYDQTVIGMRTESSISVDKLDIPKAFNNVGDLFQVYTLSADGTKLSSNAIPYDTEKVTICIHPTVEQSEMYTIKASRLETMDTEALLLHDELTGTITNLRENNSYTFLSSQNDEPERFTLYFKNKDFVSSEDGIYGYYANGQLHIFSLDENDIGSVVNVYNAKGQLVGKHIINNYPACQFPMTLNEGVYVTQVKGAKNSKFKFIKEIR